MTDSGTQHELSRDAIKQEVREYILEEFLTGEDPDELEDATPLITSGILHSISTVILVSFLEEKYDVKFQAHEMGPDHLDTVDTIAETVHSKRS